MFTQASVASGGPFPQLWIRYELGPGSEYSSYAGLEQFVCMAIAHRKISITGFPDRNLDGQGTAIFVTRAWEPVIPDSMLHIAFDMACSSP